MVMVTGGIGFIGSHICRKLIEEGEQVVIFDNFDKEKFELLKKVRIPDISDKIKVVNGDITNYSSILDTLKKYNIKKIIHTAAITFIPTAIKNPSLTFKINTEGTFNLLEAARVLDLNKFVYISTSSTYGDFQYVPADEKHPLEPKDIYGATKVAADRIAISYYRTYNLPVSIIRTSSVYGPGDFEKRVVKNFVENSLQGIPLELHGGGLQRRDFSYVKDVARGICLTTNSEKANGEIFNITGGTDYSLKEMSEIIKYFIPQVDIKEVGARSIDINRGRLDLTKAKNMLGYEPKYKLKEGIKDYIKWNTNFYFPLMGMKIKNKPIYI